MFKPENMADAVLVAQAPRGRLGKRLVWASSDSDGIWRKQTGDGRWLKPSDLGLKPDANARRTNYIYHAHECGTLEGRYRLRTELHKHNSLSLILGAPTEALCLSLVPHGEIGHYVSPPLPRSATYLTDAPRCFFTLDLDSLDLGSRGYDAYEHDMETADVIADIFDEAGLDWLITDCVMQLSSSHGLTDRVTLKMHLDWHLEEPLTLAEQKLLTNHINLKLAEAGLATRAADPTIYEARRLLFTSPAELFKRTWMPGETVQEQEVPAPHLWRVRLVSRGQARLTDIPDEVWNEVKTARAVRKITGARRPRPAEGAILNDIIQPGNVYAPIRGRIYKAALNTPAHLAARTKARLKAELRRELEALPDHAERGISRMRYLADEEIDRSWAGALEHRYTWRVATSRSDAHTAGVPIETARLSLQAHMRRAIQRGIDYARAAPTDDSLVPEPPEHLLVISPPGVGKTQAVVDAINTGHLMSERISYLAPSTELSREVVERMRQRLPDDDYTQSRVRHLLGRRQVCEDDVSGPLAEKVESLGISPLKAVCAYCSRRDVCPWPTMHENKESGFIAGQHAHVTSTLAKLQSADSDAAPVVGIIDESLLGTLLKQRFPPRSIQSLRKWTSRGVSRTRKGEFRRTATADLIAYRAELLDALETAERTVSLSRVRGLARQVPVRYGDDIRYIPALQDAMRAEADALRYWRDQVHAALKAHSEARKASASTDAANDALNRASAHVRIGEWFRVAYRCIEGSLSVPGRKHVFGLRVVDGKVSVHIRTDLPPALRERYWIWLDGTADPLIWSALVKGGASRARPVQRRLDVEAAHYHLTQYPDRVYSKSMFLGGDAKNRRDDSNLSRLHRFVEHEALQHNDVLLICQKDVEKRLLDFGLPSNVNTAHFGALRGLDAYRNVACAIIVGRPQPRNGDLEAMTEALYYDDDDVPEIESIGDNFHSHAIELPLAGPERHVAVINAEGHPDPRVRALRRQVTEAEVKQAVMRLRLFDRTERNPATLHVFGQIDTGLVVHELRDWQDAERSRVEKMGCDGVLTTNRALLEILAARASRSASTLRKSMQAAYNESPWPLYKFRVDNRPAQAKINAADAESAARILSLLGVEAREIRRA